VVFREAVEKVVVRRQWCGAAAWGAASPFYRRRRAVREGKIFFPGELNSGELERLLEAAPCDKMARAAAAGQLVSARGRLGVCGSGAGSTACIGAWR
jgi:hypothetical protein